MRLLEDHRASRQKSQVVCKEGGERDFGEEDYHRISAPEEGVVVMIDGGDGDFLSSCYILLRMFHGPGGYHFLSCIYWHE